MRRVLHSFGPIELIIVLGGFILVSTAIFANARAGEIANRTHAWNVEAQEIGRNVTLAYAGVFAHLEGDTDSLPNAGAHLDDARASCDALLDGVRDPLRDVTALRLSESRSAVIEICEEIEWFGELTERRLASEIEISREYDQALAMILDSTAHLPELITSEIDRERGFLGRLLGARVAFIVLVFTGMTWLVRRRRLEQSETAERHRLILEAASDGIVGLRRDGRIVFANAASSRMTGYETDELVGKNIHEILHAPPDGDALPQADACPILRASRDGETLVAQPETFWRKDDTPLAVEVSSTTDPDESEHAQTVLVFRDVTERRRLEQLRSEFVSVVSHELRTPLTSIHGALGLIRSGALGDLTDRAMRMIEIAHASSQRLIRLINDILDIERLDSGEIPMAERPTDLAVLVNRAVTAMEAHASDSGITIERDVEPVIVRVDPDRIEQTLVNLLGNAVKFSPEGAHIDVTAQRDADGSLRISIKDEGRGIPADRLESIFGRFEQVDATDRRELGGTGLGLAISKTIMSQHGGRIWAESRVGEGSTFTFVLPADRIVEARSSPESGRRPTVLVCDDDEAIRITVAEILETSGFDAICVESGHEAIAHAVAERPDAVVLDLLMPGTTGWEVAAELKRRDETRTIPIILLSVLATEATARALEGVEERVSKPFSPGDLLGALGRALDSSAGRPTVLLVEDDEELATLLGEMFRQSGVHTVHVRSGEEAIAWSEAHQPDVISLDVMLPGKSGFDVVNWMRRVDRLRTVPVVVYSARDLGHKDRERLRLGETAFFTKSQVPIEDFQRHVVNLLSAITGGDQKP